MLSAPLQKELCRLPAATNAKFCDSFRDMDVYGALGYAKLERDL